MSGVFEGIESLQSSFERRDAAHDALRRAQEQLGYYVSSIAGELDKRLGGVLPLAGTANDCLVSSDPWDPDNCEFVYQVSRTGMHGSFSSAFGPDFYRINEITERTVLLGRPESTNSKTGLIALLSTLRMASPEEIEEINRQKQTVESAAQV